MIEIEKLTEADKGKPVVYEDRTKEGMLIKREKGILSSWSDTSIFVRFGTGSTGQSCRPDDLHWAMVYDEFLFDPNEAAVGKDDYFPKHSSRPQIKIKA